ncbi:MAG: Sugar-phosphate isomerase, RpiB/LacA/LacB family [Parcubacteria group bacterium GW2011_GWA2_36_10]|nr:MAG: Sugar-phosphate isomerase, RpiB/LacA/LacB family [Parcubacteria group bacterium GW2011_GWA2_36_10]
MTIYLGADHDGWLLKEKIKLSLQKQGYKVSDQGNLKHEADDDYPDYAKRVALMMKKNKDSRGILCCDSGQGMLMAANRFQHLRAAFAHSEASIKQARQDEDVNVLCLMTKNLNLKKAESFINTFLSSKFLAIPRYKRRVQKLNKLG